MFTSLFPQSNKQANKLWAYLVWGWLALLALGMTGCREAAQPSTPPPLTLTSVSSTVLATPPSPLAPSATLPPTHTPAPTATLLPTPSPTPSPTPTAVAAHISGNPRTPTLTGSPEPKSGAPCGLVDQFDFPVAPPDGAGVERSGGDFGQFRDRYGKYHTGEDWGAPGPGSNLGKPVYSVGHGRVMYAQPEGWNRDKGVVIVEHVVDGVNGRQVIYSFYGHLDPPSVVLEPGSCVRRGQQVGAIGKPRTPPHLHFEMRTHMPYAPGPGYWEEDPTGAGWLPPSQTIWNQRLASAPGVAWLRTFAPRQSQPLGLWRENSFLTVENGRLTATHLPNGTAQLSPLTTTEIETGLLHKQSGVLFLATKEGDLLAFAQALLWQFKLSGSGQTALLPLAHGGVMAVRGREALGLSAEGVVLWRAELGERPFAWDFAGDQLIYTIAANENATWRVIGDAPPTPLADESGYPLLNADAVWLYAADGLYRLNGETGDTLLYALPSANLRLSHLSVLPDGGVLLAHTDAYDRRLIAFNGDGGLRWQVSLAALNEGKMQLVTTPTQSLLFTESSSGNDVQTNLYAIDANTGDLTHLFSGGSRPFSWNDAWIMPAGPSQVVINSAGGAILALDVQEP